MIKKWISQQCLFSYGNFKKRYNFISKHHSKKRITFSFRCQSKWHSNLFTQTKDDWKIMQCFDSHQERIEYKSRSIAISYVFKYYPIHMSFFYWKWNKIKKCVPLKARASDIHLCMILMNNQFDIDFCMFGNTYERIQDICFFPLKVSQKLIPTKKQKEKKLAALGLKCWKLNKKGKKNREIREGILLSQWMNKKEIVNISWHNDYIVYYTTA